MAAAATIPSPAPGPSQTSVIEAPRGRANQMNAGAAVAKGDVLLFLHADTRLPDDADALIADGLARSKRAWGRFDVRFDHGGWLALVAFMMNWRSWASGICDRRPGHVHDSRRVRCASAAFRRSR